jgi:mRNA interferase ChpB
MVSLDPAVGHEQQGTRPVLVVSPDAFNLRNGMPLVVPITSGGAFARNMGFAVSLAGSGLRTTGVVLCNQVRALDVVARRGRRVEIIPEAVMQEVLGRLLVLFQ